MSNQRNLTRDSWAIGDGWVPIVEPVVALIVKAGYSVDQVKEKFGGLRIYYSWSDGDLVDIIDGVIGVAERAAIHTCEQCGKLAAPYTHRRGEWLKTLCQACRDKRNEGA